MVPPCIEISNVYDIGPLAMVNTYACDPWAIPHVVVPFLITVWSRSWWFGFLMAGVGELVEYFGAWAFKSFVIFVGTRNGVDFNHDIESLAGSYVDDWLIQGTLVGVFLGWIFYKTFSYPRLISAWDFLNNQLWFIYYAILLFGLNVVLTGSIYRVMIGSFELGINLAWIIYGLTLLILLIWQPRDKWNGYSNWHKAEFYLGSWFINIAFQVQNQFDWFFSSAVQSWLIGGILLVLLVPIGLYRWRWPMRIRLSKWFRI